MITAAVASVVSFVHHDWLGPGEPVVAGTWLLLGLWVYASAGTIVRGDQVLADKVLALEAAS